MPGIIVPPALSGPSLSSDQTWTGIDTWSGKLKFSSGYPWFDPTSAPWNCKFDGVADDTAGLDNCCKAARDAGGGIVDLPIGTAVVSRLVMYNRVWVKGKGMRATRLYQKDSSNQDFVINYVSADAIEANGELWKLSDLMLYGNKGNQTSGRGVFIDYNPNWSAATNDDFVDPRWELERVFIYFTKGNGFQNAHRSEGRVENCHSFLCDGHGFYPSTDTAVIGCEAGGAGLAGFFTDGTNLYMSNCKSWFSGQITATSGYGFWLNNTAPGGVCLTSCSAQDNKAAGYRLDGGSHSSSLQGCVADSNSTRGVGLNAAVEIDGTADCVVDVACFERKSDGTNSFQQNAILLANGASGNKLRLTHKAHGTATIGAPVHSSSTAVAGNELSVNGQGSMSQPSFAASYTPDPYLGSIHDLGIQTAALTVNNTTQQHIGQELEIMTKQNGTGGFGFSFGTQYKVNWTPVTTANLRNSIRFRWNGTNWVQIATATGVAS